MKVADKYNLDILRQVVSLLAGGCCEWFGCSNTECDPHHIFSRENKSTRYDPDNCVWLCNFHHRAAEKEPNAFMAMMIYLRGSRWIIELRNKKNLIVKFNDEFRALWKERLLEELRRLAA